MEKARETLERLRIARETVAEVMAEMSADALIVPDAEPDIAQARGDETALSYAGAQRRAVGVLTVSKWQAGMGAEVLPRAYRSILEVVQDAPGPVRAKQVAPRIGLPAEVGKIETTRAKLKRLVARGWLDEDVPGAVRPGPPQSRSVVQLRVEIRAFLSAFEGATQSMQPEKSPGDEAV